MIALALAWGIGWLQAREEYKSQQTPTAYAAAAKDDAERACIGTDPAAVFECVNEKVKTAYQTAHDEQDLSAQQRAASSSLATTVLSFFALSISIVGVWYVKRTLDATLEAVEDTGKATNAMVRQNELTEAAQRPWIYITEIKTNFATWIHDAEAGVLTYDFILCNYGATPATIHKVQCWVEASANIDIAPPVWHEIPIPRKDILTSTAATLVLPSNGKSNEFKAMGRHSLVGRKNAGAIEELEGIIAHRSFIFLRISVLYRGVNGKEHETQACYKQAFGNYKLTEYGGQLLNFFI